MSGSQLVFLAIGRVLRIYDQMDVYKGGCKLFPPAPTRSDLLLPWLMVITLSSQFQLPYSIYFSISINQGMPCLTREIARSVPSHLYATGRRSIRRKEGTYWEPHSSNYLAGIFGTRNLKPLTTSSLPSAKLNHSIATSCFSLSPSIFQQMVIVEP